MERRRRSSTDVVVGLDVGTTKICVIVAVITGNEITVRTVASHPSIGLRKGVVIDIEATANSIRRAIADAEAQAGVAIRDVFVGIAGSHIKSLNSSGTVGIKGKEVTPEDVERAIDTASSVNISLDREVIHVLPTDFILDGQEGIRDPVGMAGVRLEVSVYIVTGATASVQNLLKCCDRAGLEVIDVILQPLASAEAVLSAEEREMGIALVDCGGGTTDIAIYKDGWLRHSAFLGIGGSHFTNDLSVGMRLPFHEAERIKKQFGSLIPEDRRSGPEVEVTSLDGHVRGIPGRYLTEILQPRCEELLDLIGQEIQLVQHQGVAVLGVVFSGGASLLTGYDRLAETILSMPVRIGYPGSYATGDFRESAERYRVVGLPAEYNSPMFATGVGLIICAAETLQPVHRGRLNPRMFNKIVSTMSDWLKRIAKK